MSVWYGDIFDSLSISAFEACFHKIKAGFWTYNLLENNPLRIRNFKRNVNLDITFGKINKCYWKFILCLERQL
jgi:hypothetical protein